MGFENKVVLVSGASSGIGAAIAEKFARQGASVVMVARNERKLKEVAQRCAAVGPTPLVLPADVIDDAAVATVIRKTIQNYNRLDILVNNAGIAHINDVLGDKLMEAYDETMNVNMRAIVRLTSLAAPHLIKTKGNIINISSVASFKPAPLLLSYATSKAALDHFTKGVALELAPHGVRVNAVLPGPVRTDLIVNNSLPGTWDRFKGKTALDNISLPEEIADLVIFMASEKAKSITGTICVSDNGFTLK